MKDKSRLAEVKDKVACDSASCLDGIFTVRRGFFYRSGRTAEDLVAAVRAELPAAVILDSGEVWKPFRGGASTARSSHWFVKFTL